MHCLLNIFFNKKIGNVNKIIDVKQNIQGLEIVDF